MAQAHIRSNVKPSGGMLRMPRKKRLYEVGSDAILTKLGPAKKIMVRTIGGNSKMRTFQADVANVYDPKSKTSKKAKIITIKDNAANRNFIRRNIMTKGCVIQTELGLAKITSRPGQEGTVNAVLVSQ